MIKLCKTHYSFILRFVISLIYLQTLYYKFNVHPDSVYIFTKLGCEPIGRITLGILELIISICILIPKTKNISILISILIILGALLSHIFIIGININGDNGKLFLLACLVFFLSITLFIYHYSEIIMILYKVKSK